MKFAQSVHKQIQAKSTPYEAIEKLHIKNRYEVGSHHNPIPAKSAHENTSIKSNSCKDADKDTIKFRYEAPIKIGYEDHIKFCVGTPAEKLNENNHLAADNSGLNKVLKKTLNKSSLPTSLKATASEVIQSLQQSEREVKVLNSLKHRYPQDSQLIEQAPALLLRFGDVLGKQVMSWVGLLEKSDWRAVSAHLNACLYKEQAKAKRQSVDEAEKQCRQKHDAEQQKAIEHYGQNHSSSPQLWQQLYAQVDNQLTPARKALLKQTAVKVDKGSLKLLASESFALGLLCEQEAILKQAAQQLGYGTLSFGLYELPSENRG